MSEDYPASNGIKVLSTFAGVGGSTMGYKLAGFDVVGINEIDQRMMDVYELNHQPRFSYCEDIRTFRKRDDLPGDFCQVDVLDGSPPCSTFSMSGKREKDWGRTRAFTEGQSEQVLDDLFGEFVALARRLKPRIVVAENVTGIVSGNARGYAKEVVRLLEESGYAVQIFILNAATMGVPQRRRRVFFIARLKTLDWPDLILNYDEPPITWNQIKTKVPGPRLAPKSESMWCNRKFGDRTLAEIRKRMGLSDAFFNWTIAHPNKPLPTIAAAKPSLPVRPDFPNHISDDEIRSAFTFPVDFDFGDLKPQYAMGMSVPPVMIANIMTDIRRQWFDRE